MRAHCRTASAPSRRASVLTRKPVAVLDCDGFDESGPSPFRVVLSTASGLEAGQLLRVRLSVDPSLLDLVLDGRGFSLWSERGTDGRWTVDVLRRLS